MNRKTLAVILILLSFAVSLHQYYVWGSFFEMKDVDNFMAGDVFHHETYIVTLALSGKVL